MKKLIWGGLCVALMGTPVLAQEIELFPELQGQFEQIAPDEPQAPQAEEDKTELTKPSKKKFQKELTEDELSARQALENGDTDGQKKEGNLKIQLRNMEGTLPYVRTMAYCYADAVLTNETNRTLKKLAVRLTYGDMGTDLNYGGVRKKGRQQRKILLIGPPCEQILGMPQIDIKACEMENMTEDACKKRVQFVAPNT